MPYQVLLVLCFNICKLLCLQVWIANNLRTAKEYQSIGLVSKESCQACLATLLGFNFFHEEDSVIIDKKMFHLDSYENNRKYYAE
jgi:hypothetical protein